MIQHTMQPGMTVSHVARLHGVSAKQIFKWRSQYEEGQPTAVSAGKQVVPVSELAAAAKQIPELQRLLGKRPWRRRPSQKPWSMAAPKVGFRMRPFCPGMTGNRRQPLLRRIACFIYISMGGSPLSASVQR